MAAEGSRTYPGTVQNERSSQEPKRRGAATWSARALVVQPGDDRNSVGLGELEREFHVLAEQVRRRDPCNVRGRQTQTFRIEGKGMGGIRRAGRRRGPGLDPPFPPSAQRARRLEPVSQAAWSTIIRPYWRGAATASGLTVGAGGELVTASACLGNRSLLHQPPSDEVDRALVVPGAVDVAPKLAVERPVVQ